MENKDYIWAASIAAALNTSLTNDMFNIVADDHTSSELCKMMQKDVGIINIAHPHPLPYEILANFKNHLYQATTLVVNDINSSSEEKKHASIVRKDYEENGDWLYGDILTFISYFSSRYDNEKAMKLFIRDMILLQRHAIRKLRLDGELLEYEI